MWSRHTNFGIFQNAWQGWRWSLTTMITRISAIINSEIFTSKIRAPSFVQNSSQNIMRLQFRLSIQAEAHTLASYGAFSLPKTLLSDLRRWSSWSSWRTCECLQFHSQVPACQPFCRIVTRQMAYRKVPLHFATLLPLASFSPGCLLYSYPFPDGCNLHKGWYDCQQIYTSESLWHI